MSPNSGDQWSDSDPQAQPPSGADQAREQVKPFPELPQQAPSSPPADNNDYAAPAGVPQQPGQPYQYAQPPAYMQPQPYAQPQAFAQPQAYAQPGQPLAGVPVQQVVAPKNPAVSLILSFFIPGLGTMVNGNVGRGVLILVLYVVGWVLSLLLIGIPLLIGAWIWGLVDGYTSAQRWNREHGIIS
jgi:TM2 domain-containing membrane protein YozV